MFPAFVQRRVDVGNAAREHRRESVAYGGNVPAGDGIDASLIDQRTHFCRNSRGITTAVDHFYPDLAAQNAARVVQVAGNQLAHRLT